jgi:hypothetical protein
MAFTKFNRSEKASVLSPEKHKKIDAALKRVGKSSVSDLTEKELTDFNKSINK